MKLLLIEDDLVIAGLILKGLKENGFAADHAQDGLDGLDLALNESYDLAIIDIILPRLSGLGSVDLSRVVADACDLFEPVVEQKKLQLQLENLEPCQIRGNLHNLQRMVANLIDNAIKYTPEGGSIRISMAMNANLCRIIVSDTGIDISAQNQPRIFERFYRCDESRASDGCGLGLSFSRAVAKQHGGDILLERSQPHTATVFTILLPCA